MGAVVVVIVSVLLPSQAEISTLPYLQQEIMSSRPRRCIFKLCIERGILLSVPGCHCCAARRTAKMLRYC